MQQNYELCLSEKMCGAFVVGFFLLSRFDVRNIDISTIRIDG